MPLSRQYLATALAGTLAAASPALTSATTDAGPPATGRTESATSAAPAAAASGTTRHAPAPPTGRLTVAANPDPSPAPKPRASAPPGGPPSLQVVGQAAKDGYLLRVEVGGGRPDDVEVTPTGQALTISLAASTATAHEERLDAGSGYRSDASGSQGSVTRRVPLPADADLRHLTREVSGNALLLHIPRIGGRKPAPAAPR